MIIFSDIDGTLFSQKWSRIPKSAKAAVQLARKNGHKFFLCTGRGLATTNKYLNYDVDGFVFAVGSLIYVEGKKMYNHPIREEVMDELIKNMDAIDIGYMLEGSAGSYGNDFGYECNSKYFAGAETDSSKVEEIMAENGIYHLSQWHKKDPIYKLVVFEKHENHMQELELPEGLHIVPAKYDIFPHLTGEISRSANNKATAIQRVIEYYGVSKEETVAIGDNTNDIEMLEYANVGICMGNGAPEAKEAADYITTDIHEHGMWNALKYVGAIEGEYEGED